MTFHKAERSTVALFTSSPYTIRSWDTSPPDGALARLKRADTSVRAYKTTRRRQRIMTKPFSITRQVRHFLVVALLLMSSAMASAQTTMFTYQGRLNDSGNAANGVVDMQFKLYDAADPSVSAQIGSTITNSNVAVTNGIFTVRLDFGASALPGANRFIEVGVRRISSDPYTVLAPRQQVTSAPYAIRSANAVVADQLSTACLGCVQDAQINAVAGSKLTGTLPASSIPAGNSNYIQSNPTAQQAGANFNISGNGTAGTLNAAMQY